MAPSKDDSFSLEYKYAWTKDSDITLQEFLTKYKPSMVQDDGTKPWIWVSKDEPHTEEDVDREGAQEEAQIVLEDVTERVEAIQNDASIPIRANKKKGTKSKKELREAVQVEASEKLKDISIKHKYVVGKWLIFASPEKVDFIWSTIATSLIDGPLSTTCAYRAKVATSPQEENPNYQHVLCLYMPNVYDKDRVTEVMKVLLRQHGMNLMGVKSDLYTGIGLDSKHPSGIQSTVWKNSALMKDTEMKELREQYFAEQSTSKAPAGAQKASDDTVSVPASSGKPVKGKPKLKKKVADDPFASDSETTEATKPIKASQLSKKKPQAMFESDDDDDDEQRRKADLQALKKAAKGATTQKRRKAEDSEDDVEQPKKKAGRK